MPNLNRLSWVKWAAIILLLYVLIGGLMIPLKTGVSSISLSNFETGKKVELKLELYNPPTDFQAKSIVLKAEKSSLIIDSLRFNKIEGNTIEASFIPYLMKSADSGMYDLFLNIDVKNESKIKNQWMLLPDAVWISKGINDSLNHSKNTEVTNHENDGKSEFQFAFPNRVVLYESIRNLLYHVPMWFSMMFLLLISMIYAILYLNKSQNHAALYYDQVSESFAKVGILAGILGCVTGSFWASVTWGSWWPANDPKLNGVAIGMFMYLAYLILRSTLKDPYQRARISSIYAILIYPIFIALIAIMPKLAEDSLHPGSGGTVGFNKYDLDSTLRMFFYPAVLGWIALFSWMAILKLRILNIQQILDDKNEND